MYMIVSIFILFNFYLYVSSKVKPFDETPREWQRDDCKDNDTWFLRSFYVPVPYGIWGDEFKKGEVWSYFGPNDTRRMKKKSPPHPHPHRRARRSQVPKRRITWGDIVNAEEYSRVPFLNICAIRDYNEDFFWCTCTIINSMWVLTIRSCFKAYPDNPSLQEMPSMIICWGSVYAYRRTNEECSMPAEMHYHPDKRVNAAIILLDNPIKLSAKMPGFYPYTWLKTTGYKNFIKRCSTFTCGFVKFLDFFFKKNFLIKFLKFLGYANW